MKTVKEMREDLQYICDSNRDCTGCPNCLAEECGSNGGYAIEKFSEDKVRTIHKELFPDDYENDPVNHPAHYTSGKIEVADFIADQKLNFDRGNAVKYLCRAGIKDPACEIQDLEKASWYINHEIKTLKERNNDRN